MWHFDFQAKLRKLNPDLFIYTDEIVTLPTGVQATGIYQKNVRQPKNLSDSELNYAGEGRKLLEGYYSGNLPKYICGISYPEIPEYDIEHLKIKGYRSILKFLIKNRLVSKDKAEKVFNCHLD